MLDRNLYFQIWGHGEMSSNQACEAVSSTLDPVTGLGTMILNVASTTPFENQEGSTIWISTSDLTELPNGYYTLVSVDTGAGQVTIRGSRIVAGASGGVTTTIRIEDFYKFCTGIPSYVTGDLARERWLPIVTDVTATIGQKVSVLGGASSIGGLTISTVYSEDAAFTNLLRLEAQYLTTNASPGGGRVYLANEISASTDGLDVNADVNYDQTGVNGNVTPSWIGNTEAIYIYDADNSPSIYVYRGVLKTGYYSSYTGPYLDSRVGSTHPKYSILHYGLPNGQGARMEIFTFDCNTLTYDDHDLIYFGLIDNINFENGISSIDFEVSSALIAGQSNNFASKLPQGAKVDQNWTFSDGAGTFFAQVPQYLSSYSWNWIKIGNLAVRLRNADLTETVYSPIYNQVTGLFTAWYPIDNISFYQDSAGVIDPANVNELGDPYNYMDNCVLLQFQEDPDLFDKYRRPGALNAREEVFVRKDDYDYRDGTRKTGPDFVYTIKDSYLLEEQTSLCHVFEPYERTKPGTAPVNSAYNGMLYYPPIHVYDLILQILLSRDGRSINTIFDVLPTGLGLGIPAEKIDFQSFGLRSITQLFDLNASNPVVPYYVSSSLTIDSLILQGVHITREDAEDILSWLSKNVLKPLGLLLVQDQAGRIALSDIASLDTSKTLIPISDVDLADEDARVDVKLENDGSKVFSSISFSWKNPAWDPTLPGVRESSSLVRNTINIPDSEDAAIQSLLYPNQATPIEYTMKFAPVYNLVDGSCSWLTGRGVFLIKYLSQPLPTFTFRLRTPTVRPSYPNGLFESTIKIGDLIDVNFSKPIGPDGTRGFIGLALISDLREDVLRQSTEVKVILISSVRVPPTVTWGSSTMVTGIVGGDPTQITINNVFGYNTFSPITASTEFENGDLVLLYDENFNLKSVTAGLAPRPQTIVNIIETKVQINSSFKNPAGSTVTPVAGDIILLAEKSLQPVNTQEGEAWMNDNISIWRP